jgi:hypothetical protein
LYRPHVPVVTGDNTVSNSDPLIECSFHGKAHATYICGHLTRAPRQQWFCAYPTVENLWPDAWCVLCDRAFQQYGEWNDKNENVLDIKLLCHCCYEERKGGSVAPLMKSQQKTWQPFLQSSMAELNEKQEFLNERFDLCEHERWDWDQETGEILFSNAGVPAVTARFQFVGTISTVNDTWLWSWSNFSFQSNATMELLKVREFGEARDFANLTIPKWPAAEVSGWEMIAVAASVLDARGAYRTPGETGLMFMLLMDVKRRRWR